jgi:Family of unknown function (DUF6074)
MTCSTILAFPLGRRHSLIKKLTAQMLARSSAEAEKHLTFELRRHRRILHHRQLKKDVIEQQLRSLEAAVRMELWRVVMKLERPRGKL